MRRLTVEYRPTAAENIEDIFAYVLAKTGNPHIATGYTDRIFARCESIGDAPFGGIARPDLGEGIRMVPFEKSAVILYVVEADHITITNIFAGGRDYEALLRRHISE